MSINTAIDKLKEFFHNLLGRDIQVRSMVPNEDGWDAEFEVIHEDEYMWKRARKDILAVYEAKMDTNFEVISYSRKGLTERGSLE